MANYANLKAAVNAAITTNGNNEITGAILNDILNSIISTIGGNYTLAGVVTPSTTISAPDANVFWIGGAGTYTQFGGTITIAEGNIGVFTYNGNYTRTEIPIAPNISSAVLTTNQSLSDAQKEQAQANIGLPLLGETAYFKLFTANTPTMLPEKYWRSGSIQGSGNGAPAPNNYGCYSVPVPYSEGSIIISASDAAKEVLLGIRIQLRNDDDFSSTDWRFVHTGYNWPSSAVALPSGFKYITFGFYTKNNVTFNYSMLSGVTITTSSDWKSSPEVSDVLGDIETLQTGLVGLSFDAIKNAGIFKDFPSNASPQILCVKDLSIQNSVSGYRYALQVNQDVGTFQQSTIFRYPNGSSSYDAFAHFKYKTGGGLDTGIKHYTTTLSTGEVCKIVINWDELTTRQNLLNGYTLHDWVFLGGRLSEDIAPNDFVNTDTIVDSAVTTQKIANESVTESKLAIEVGNFFIDNKVEGYSRNLITPSDIYPNPLWSDGELIKVANTTTGNVVSWRSTGVQASWQSYATAFLKVSDLRDRYGIDFSASELFISAGFKQLGASLGPITWFILRYGVDDSKSFYSTGSVDAVFNASGARQGLGASDTTTWAAFSVSRTNDYQVFNNIKVPATYDGKDLYAIMLCFGGDASAEKTKTDVRINLVGGIEVQSFSIISPLAEQVAENTEGIASLNERVDELDGNYNGYYAACGDSITNANHTGIEDVPDSDEFCPIDGYTQVSTYKRKCYAYFIAKQNRMKWANYGWGGSTLIKCHYNGISTHGFMDDTEPLVRYTSLADYPWSYISFFFGWNDSAYGPVQQREIWLKNTYGSDIYWPMNTSQIGTTHGDGTPYATQAQYDACKAVTGSVGGVQYDDNTLYFRALFVGTIDSDDERTWCGAWNKLFKYFMPQYPNAKLMIIVPYQRNDNDGPSTMQRDATIAMANRYGIEYYDFRDECKVFEPNSTPMLGEWTVTYGGRTITLPSTVYGFNRSRFTYDTLHPNQAGYNYMWRSINSKLMSV